MLYDTRFKTGRTVAINAKVLATKSRYIFFATNPPDPQHLTINSCFGAFRSVWVDLVSFRNCTKLGAKWAELGQLMQKFVPPSRFRISRNEHTRSTP